MIRRNTRTAVLTGLAVVASFGSTLVATPAQAQAIINPLGEFKASIDVGLNGGANGLVSDSISPTSVYITELTATGSGTCGLIGAAVVIADASNPGIGNPASTNTEGACNLYNATAEYTLTWTSILGTTGTFQRTCTWLLGVQRCTPREVRGSGSDFVSG